MRDNLSPWAEDDIAQLRYQLRQSQIAKVKAASVVRALTRNPDVRACSRCGYQKCDCPGPLDHLALPPCVLPDDHTGPCRYPPPEPVEEAKPAGEWRDEYSAYGLCSLWQDGRIVARTSRSVTYPGRWYATLMDGGHETWADTEAEAKAWVEEQCST